MRSGFPILLLSACLLFGCSNSHPAAGRVAAAKKIPAAARIAVADAHCQAKLDAAPKLPNSLPARKSESPPVFQSLPPVMEEVAVVEVLPRYAIMFTAPGCKHCKPAWKDIQDATKKGRLDIVIEKDPKDFPTPDWAIQAGVPCFYWQVGPHQWVKRPGWYGAAQFKQAFDDSRRLSPPPRAMSPQAFHAFSPQNYVAPTTSAPTATDLLATYLGDGPFSIPSGMKRLKFGITNVTYGPALTGQLRGRSVLFSDPKPRASIGPISVPVQQMDVSEYSATFRTAVKDVTIPIDTSALSF